ncbi:MAG: GntR family transcriptional regulator [Nocardioides sp.]|uniref:GntR family transcriptional regulator n=1 Tax=Nocardioides sp. TaxID=35761 RepID=UPI0039E6A0FC
MSAGIDRSSPMPFYHQLKESLRARIEEEGLGPGARLPGDHELCETYDVSRTVVRQALSQLEMEGVIERIKGRGTYVAQPKVAEGLVQSLTGLYEDVAARGGHLRSEVRRLEVVPADEHVAGQLELEVGTPVVEIERLRFVDDEPWVLAITYVPESVAPRLVEEDLTHQSLYAVLERDYGVGPARGRRSVEAMVAGPELAKDLGVGENAPILVLRSVSTDADGRPMESFVAYHRGDRSRFEVELSRVAGADPRPLMQVTEV